MLKLKNIKKTYYVGDVAQEAVKGISLTFNKGEFVSIIGPSGCGKTTTLNIVGGLDRYTSGDLEINGVSTKEFKDSDWDSYRNNSVGFVFQSYNLVGHISVLANVELGMTLSGIGKVERQKRAIEVLTRVGLEDHLYKRPNQLSGGQRQRVAIARALANDPEIILADEPTGAIDSKTSVEIMELIKEISNDKLVIMVTHNKELAEKYSSRIVTLKDGLIIDDTNHVEASKQDKDYKPKKTSMSFLTALSLSFNNLKTKFGRTLITALAGSIGIVGVALVLSISNGMNDQIAGLESDQLASMPITISETMTQINVGPPQRNDNDSLVVNEGYVTPYDPREEVDSHKNVITEEYVEYVELLDEELVDAVQYITGVQLNVLSSNEKIELANGGENNLRFRELPDDQELILSQYELIEGTYPNSANETVLVVDQFNRINQKYLTSMGFDVSSDLILNDVLGHELVVALNDDYYAFNEMFGLYAPVTDFESTYSNGIRTKIVGILRPIIEDEEATNGDLQTVGNLLQQGVYYTSDLTAQVLDNAKDSEVALAQVASEVNIFTNQEFSEFLTKDDVLKGIGAVSEPVGIMIYPKDFDAKEEIKLYLDGWNEGLEQDEQIIYEDLAEIITDLMGDMIGLIQTVLVAFAAISLVVSAIMIGIITYVSVLERTKEIGILRSLGARKKDIKRVFNAETVIVGFVAGTLGILITFLLSFPINNILSGMLDIDNIVQMDITESLMLVALSVGLTLLSGLIPASIASRKNPVDALRTE